MRRYGSPRFELRDDTPGSERDHEADLAQQSAHGVDARRPSREPGGSHAVEPCDHVLVDLLDRHGPEISVAQCLEQGLRVRPVGLVPQHVGPHRVWRKQHDPMPTPLCLPTPMVRRAASLHHHCGRHLPREEALELAARQPSALRDLAGLR
jgi:hypothetical protein